MAFLHEEKNVVKYFPILFFVCLLAMQGLTYCINIVGYVQGLGRSRNSDLKDIAKQFRPLKLGGGVGNYQHPKSESGVVVK